jgi:hypothetical protein
MRAILSSTEHDFYAFPLPIVAYSWDKIGVKSICFIPRDNNPKLELAKKYCNEWCQFVEFNCAPFRIPTYSQVSRLLGAALRFDDDNTVLITGDSDLAVFGTALNICNDGNIHIIGADLTPDDQYPMCFIAMPVKTWRKVMQITASPQQHLEEIINPIQSSNLRGTAWCLDQWLIKKKISEHPEESVFLHKRARAGTQFADHRVDRDDQNWRSYLGSTLLDAHLWRPGYTDDNFANILELLQTQYPNEDFDWLREYRNQYIQLL